MRYQGKIYRPPSEADSYILQATIGCSWNKCTYCDMYREKEFSVRPLEETLEDVAAAGEAHGDRVQKVFVADGDALILDMAHWRAILTACRDAFPSLRRVSCYAMASNVLAKSAAELREQLAPFERVHLHLLINLPLLLLLRCHLHDVERSTLHLYKIKPLELRHEVFRLAILLLAA